MACTDIKIENRFIQETLVGRLVKSLGSQGSAQGRVTMREMFRVRVVLLPNAMFFGYPRSKIGEIGSRIGPELNRSQLKRALAELVGLSVVVMEGERNGARYRLAGEK